MADVQQTYKFSFEFNRKDIKKQLKEISLDVKDAISQIGDASDKVVIFKELVSYLSNVDKALDAFKTKHKDDFSNIFGSPDKEILGVLTEIFNTTQQSAQAFTTLKDKIAAAESGKANLSTLKGIAEEINALFVSIGQTAKIDIDAMFKDRGSKAKGTDFASRIKLLNDTLNEFGVTYSGFQNRLKGGFGFGSTGGLSKAVQEEIEKLKKQKEEYLEIIDAFSGKNIKVKTSKKTDVAQLQELIDKFNEAQAAVQQFENANNTSGDAYKKAVAEAFKIATLLKNTMDYVAEYGSDEGNLFVSSNVGKNDPYSLAEKYIKDLKKTNLFSDVQAYFNQQLQGIDTQINKLQNPTDSTLSLYDELNQKVREYLELRKQINTTDRDKDPQEYKRLINRKNEIAAEIEQLKELDTDGQDALYDVFEEADSDGAKLNEIVEKFCNVLQIEIPNAAESASSATGSAFAKITQDATEASEAVQNVMYHLGNLLNGQGKPRDTFGDMAENLTSAAAGTRWEQYGFGALGGGLFGVSDPSTITQNPGASTFIQSIDLSKYNMYMANTEERATALIDFLSKLQKFSMKSAEPNYTGFDAQLQGLDIDALYGQAKLVFDQAELTKDQFEDFIDEMVAMLKLAGLAFDTQTGELNFTNLTKEIANSENISTRFMKMLGYHGVNVGGTSFDGLGQGSVLFDFDKVDIVGYFNTIQEAVEDYQKIINQINGGNWVGSIEQLQQYSNNIDNIINKLTEAKDTGKLLGDSGVDETLSKLTQIRQNIGDILSGKDVSDNNPFVTITTGSAEAGNAIEQAKTKLQEFLSLAEEIKNKDFVKNWDATDNIEIGKDIQRLEETRAALLELGKQGLLMAEDLEKAEEAFTLASTHMRVETNTSYSHGGGGGYYYESYESEYESAKNANQALQEQLNIMRQLSEIDKQIGLTHDYQVDELDHLIEQRRELLNLAEQDGNLSEEDLVIQRAITNEYEARSQFIKDGYDKAFDDFYKELNYLNSEDLVKMDLDTIDGYSNRLNSLYSTLSEARDNYLLDDSDGGTFDYIEQHYREAMSTLNDARSKLFAIHGSDVVNERNSQSSAEYAQLELLEKKLLEVKAAVDAKTQAFEEEYVTVDGVVDSEIVSLQSLIAQLQEVIAQVNLVGDAFSSINTNIPKIEIGSRQVEQNGASFENTHYVTDPQGRPVNAYRGIDGAYGGLVSNRYHGGTFWTTNIELAKEYAGEIGKVEKSLLSMKNPMEIDGHGAYWNQIEYIGDNSDEASQKLHQLNATIKQTEEILEHLKTIQPTEQELKNLSRGLIVETQNEREIREYTAELEKAKAERDAIFADSSNPYGKKNTNELVEIAKAKGYDGVIFKDIIDSATGSVTDLSTVMVTFEQDQIHYLETISSTFESSVATLKNRFGDLIQHISASSDEIETSIRKMAELKGKVQTGEISEDEYNAFISGNAIARDYEKLARKSRAVPDFITGALDGNEFELKHVVERINGMIENMRERMQNIAKAFGKEETPLDQLLNASVSDEVTGGNESVDVNKGYALDSTLLTTNGILNNILAAIGNNESISHLVEPLNNVVAALKKVADDNIERQKRQQTDTSTAMSKIADPVQYKQISDIAAQSVGDLGSEVQIKSLKALADGAIKVEGAFKNAQDEWEGFTVHVNDSNQAIDLAVNKQSAFAKALNETASKANETAQEVNQVQEVPVEDTFTKAIYNQKQAFNEYRDSLQNVDYLTDNLRTELDALGTSLQQVGDQPGLDAWGKSFDVLKNSIKEIQSEFAQMNNSKIDLYQKELNSTFNKLTLPQKEELFEEYAKAIILLNKQRQAVKEGHAVELSGIKQITSALQEKIDAQIQANKVAKDAEKAQKTNAKFGSTASINATAKYNSLTKTATSDQFANSSEVANALARYEERYKRLIKMRDDIRTKNVIDDSDREAFKTAAAECNNYAKALEKIIDSSLKLKNKKVNPDDYMLGDDFVDDKDGRIAALTDFVKKIYDVDVAAEDFKDGWNKVVFAVDNGDGTFTQMTATFTDARNEIVALAGDTKKVQGAFANFFDELKGKFKSIGAYLVASFSFHEVWQVIRQGVNYVREIDSALTELKKVTDETDASYRQFLQDMSKTGAVIGATVKDLTTMASEWARLGYSLEESAKLAESTAILLNVSEFKDATAASEALISTMQAFQYTADESQHVVDILNEVGNNYAVSSDGIATALQDSASALMEGGNNLEQAVALVAAANRVVQDPNSVGSALRTISLRLRGTSVEVLEEIGEETDGVVESTSKLQEKIKALSGVDILTDAGEYKDTYTILKEIGNVWEDMYDIDQAALLELMAGGILARCA